MSKTEFLEQKFKVTKETSFIDMRDEACLFWGLEDKKDLFNLVLPNLHNIMSLNSDTTHMAHTISQYFEIHRSKKAILLLIQSDLNRKHISEEEKMYIIIKGAETT